MSASAELRNQSEMDAILANLADSGYKPVLFLAARVVQASLGSRNTLSGSMFKRVSADSYIRSSESIAGDILSHGQMPDGSLLVIQPIGSNLHLWEIKLHLHPSKLSETAEDVARAAREALDGRRLRGMKFEWKSVDSPPRARRGSSFRPRQNPVNFKSTPAAYTPEEWSCVEIFLDDTSRAFMLRLAQVVKARSIDAKAEGGAEKTATLLNAGLIRKEFLVLCGRDGRTLGVVENQEDLSGSAGGVRCSHCGKNFREENTQEIFALTPLARKMLEGSHWMTIWVTSLIEATGVPLSAISWGATSGQDELDVVVEVDDRKIFFELKDREFGLGDAYPFNSRISRYAGTAGVVVTTATVAPEVKAFFAELSANYKIHSIEGAEHAQTEVAKIINSITLTGVFGALRAITSYGDLDVSPLVLEWMSGGD